jgi:hypothetical protein
MTVQEIKNPTKSNKDNADKYNELCKSYDLGDISALEKMAECILKAGQIRDLIVAIVYD